MENALSQFKPTTRIRIVYFDVRARAEQIQLMCAYKKCPIEQLNVKEFFGTSWQHAKPLTPYGSLPILVMDDGSILAQTGAIARYVGSQLGLVPKDAAQAAFADSVWHASYELSHVNPIGTLACSEAALACSMLDGWGADAQ